MAGFTAHETQAFIEALAHLLLGQTLHAWRPTSAIDTPADGRVFTAAASMAGASAMRLHGGE